MNGVNVNLSNYYMLHVWVLDDMKFIPDVFAGQIPCIYGWQRHPRQPNHPCHTSRTSGAAAALTTRSAGSHSMVCRLEEGVAS